MTEQEKEEKCPSSKEILKSIERGFEEKVKPALVEWRKFIKK